LIDRQAALTASPKVTGPHAPPLALALRAALLALCAALLLSGCAVRTVYNQLDWLTIWYTGRYFERTPEQEAGIREIVDRNFDWHRSAHLPRYSALLRTASAALGGSVEAGQLAGWYDESTILWAEFREQLLPDLTSFLATLSDEQVDDMFERLARDNEELAEEYSGATPAKRRQRQDKTILRTISRVTGRLSPEQTSLVQAHTARMHDVADEWIGRRRAWQSAFRQALATRNSAPEFASALADLVSNPDQFDTPDYRRRADDNRRIIYSMLADLSAALTPDQRRHAREWLEDLALDMDRLASKAT
jgi:hypothetical protein